MTQNSPSISTVKVSQVGSLDKAFSLLEALSEAGQAGLTLQEISEKTGLNKPTTHRFLKSLVVHEFATHKSVGAYSLGPAAFRLAQKFFGHSELDVLFKPLLIEISRQTEELVHLGALDGRRVVYLDKIEPERSLRVWSKIGRRAHIATTALGRAITALHDFDDESLEAIAEEVHDADQELSNRFKTAVRAAQINGYALEIQENEPNIACVATSFRSVTGQEVAISVTGPVERMSTDRRGEIAHILLTEGKRLAPQGFKIIEPEGSSQS